MYLWTLETEAAKSADKRISYYGTGKWEHHTVCTESYAWWCCLCHACIPCCTHAFRLLHSDYSVTLVSPPALQQSRQSHTPATLLKLQLDQPAHICCSLPFALFTPPLCSQAFPDYTLLSDARLFRTHCLDLPVTCYACFCVTLIIKSLVFSCHDAIAWTTCSPCIGLCLKDFHELPTLRLFNYFLASWIYILVYWPALLLWVLCALFTSWTVVCVVLMHTLTCLSYLTLPAIETISATQTCAHSSGSSCKFIPLPRNLSSPSALASAYVQFELALQNIKHPLT